jgi:hypothetical protein
MRTLLIIVLGLVLNISVLWVYLRYRKFKTSRDWVKTVIGLATIVAVIVPVFIMFSLPVAASSDSNAFHFKEPDPIYDRFWGSKDRSEVSGIEETFEWGPSYGWGLYLLVPILDLLMFFTVFPPRRPSEVRLQLHKKPSESKADAQVTQQVETKETVQQQR